MSREPGVRALAATGCALAIALAAAFASAVPGPGGAALPPLQPLVDATPEGATLRPPPGAWAGPVVIRRPITIDGGGSVTIDARGKGSVVRIETDGVTLRGLRISGSGSNHDSVDAGIGIAGSRNVIEDNEIEDCLFGIDLAQSNDNVLRRNRIHSKARELAMRGDAIRLWYSFRNRILENEIAHVRDTVAWYSSDNVFSRNRFTQGRYGLHMMYANGNVVEDNEFRQNLTGIFLMYSDRAELRRNRILGAQGAAGVGVGFKESSEATLEDNDIVYCATGILLDVSPYEPDTVNLFSRNRIAYNGVGVLFHTDWTGNEFRANEFRGNFSQVAVRGGGSAIRNLWQGNHWDDYEGFDRDGDGDGDTPYELHAWADRIWMEMPPAAFFRASPVLEAIDFLDRLAPFSSPILLLRDESPRFDARPRRGVAASEAS
jgi:nitrous oxidase accessory protein